MKNKQSVLFILVGVACATLAVFFLRKYMSGSAGPPPPPPGITMLVATKDIAYGDQIVLGGKDGDVTFVKGWPRDLNLNGAFTDPDAFKGRKLRAVADIVQHQPIVEALVVDDEDFIPPDMTVQALPADSRDIRMAGIRAGMIVDIFQVVNLIPQPFMKNVRVYAMGRLDAHRKPVKEKNPPPNVYILIKQEDALAFMTGVAGKKLKVIRSTDPSGEGPILVDATADTRVKREEAQAALEAARTLMRDGDYEGALARFEQVTADYSDLKDLCKEAGDGADKCVHSIAERLYGKAERAYQVDRNYPLALEFIDEIERTCSEAQDVVRKARQLQVAIQEAVAANRALVRYQGLLVDLQGALQAGDLPRAAELLGQVETFDPGTMPADADVKKPADAAAEYGRQLREAESKFKIDRAVVEAHVKQRNVELARQKLAEMKEEFPAHPDIAVLEALVNGVGA